MFTPGESVRKFCVECVQNIYEVKNCGGDVDHQYVERAVKTI